MEDAAVQVLATTRELGEPRMRPRA
jgi:hypothetical protein